ncbi:MAG: MBL fold metallo-hydrolase [Chloroflexaceae bacterium]|jgi:L-ascorbate metabolism protein UlaG (beta-lactamase superfamily)|nr:MBL fold metallo-hydrolase [Chloroflexaceae bacterium]
MPTYTDQALIDQMNQVQVPPGCLAIWGLGQMGYAIKGNKPWVVYIDPCLSDVVARRFLPDKFQRAFPPPLAPDVISNAGYVLCSHEHLDHCDPLTLGPIANASPQAKFVISGWCHDVLDEAKVDPQRRVVPIANRTMQLDGLRLTAIPAAHYNLEEDGRGQRWLGFIIEWNGVTLYHSGDTIVYPGYLERMRLYAVDVALVAANGRDAYRDSFGVTGNLLPAEAAWLANELGWDTLIGGHNDLYAWNTVGAGELAEAVARINPRQKWHSLQPGALFFYVR